MVDLQDASRASQCQRRPQTLQRALPHLDYQLGLESDTEAADAAYLREALYRSHAYAISQPDDWQKWAGKLHGKVVLVNGSGSSEQVVDQGTLNDALNLRCKVRPRSDWDRGLSPLRRRWSEIV
jgi:hypothetical protein